MRLDAHQHFWDLTEGFEFGWLDTPPHDPIHRSFLPDDLRPLLDAAGIDASIFVQTQHDTRENDWVLQLTESVAWIPGIVGWVDLASDACEAQAEKYGAHPRFVGVRHVTQDEPDDDFIIRPAIIRGLKVLQRHGIPFDLLFYARHLKHAAFLGRELPELRMVIDHLSKPVIREKQFEQWHRELKAAAECSNIYCKISGLVTEADWDAWTPEDLKPYVDAALEAFGAERCMFGSDWPVCLLAADYQRVVQTAELLTNSLSAAEQARVFGGTAIEFYGLNLPA